MTQIQGKLIRIPRIQLINMIMITSKQWVDPSMKRNEEYVQGSWKTLEIKLELLNWTICDETYK